MSKVFFSSSSMHVTYRIQILACPKDKTIAFLVLKIILRANARVCASSHRINPHPSFEPCNTYFRGRTFLPFGRFGVSSTAVSSDDLLMARRSRPCRRSQTRDNGFTKSVRTIRRFTSDVKQLNLLHRKPLCEVSCRAGESPRVISSAPTACEDKRSSN